MFIREFTNHLYEGDVVDFAKATDPAKTPMTKVNKMLKQIGLKDYGVIINKPFDSKIYELLIDTYMNKVFSSPMDNKILDYIIKVYQKRGEKAKQLPPTNEGTRCWKGYKKKGMKTMFGKRVPNCVKKEAVEDETIEEKATIPVKGYTDAEEFISDFWFYGHNPSEMVSHIGPRSRPTWVFIKDPKHKELDKFLDDNDMSYSKLHYDELKVVLWLAKKMNISPMTVLRYGSDSIRFNTDTIKAVKQIVAKSKEAVEEDLRAWFGKGKKGGAGGGGWDRYNTKGERIGKCGDSKKGEGKPKCLSKSRAASLRAKGGKKAIAAAVRKKRREDPNKNRKGKAKNVSNTTRKTKK